MTNRSKLRHKVGLEFLFRPLSENVSSPLPYIFPVSGHTLSGFVRLDFTPQYCLVRPSSSSCKIKC